MPELYKVTALPDEVKEKIVTPKGEIDQQKGPTNASSKKDAENAGGGVVNEKVPTNLQKKIHRLNVDIQLGKKGKTILCKLEGTEKAEKTKNSLQKVLVEDERPTLPKPKVTLTIKVPDFIMSRDTEDIAAVISIDVGKAMNELRLQAKEKIMAQQVQFKKDQEAYRLEVAKLRKEQEELLAKNKAQAREGMIFNLVTGGLSTLLSLTTSAITVVEMTVSLVSSIPASLLTTAGASFVFLSVPTYLAALGGVGLSVTGSLGNFSCDIAAAYIESNETDEKKKEKMMDDIGKAKLAFTIITVAGTVVTACATVVGIFTMPGTGVFTGGFTTAKRIADIGTAIASISSGTVMMAKGGYDIKAQLVNKELIEKEHQIELKYIEQKEKMINMQMDQEAFNKTLDQLRDWQNQMQGISQWISEAKKEKSRTEEGISRNF
jgi:hypothetical protein